MLTIEDRGPPIKVEDLARLEAVFGARIPDDYKSFLLTYNGGSPLPDAIDIPGWSGQTTDVNFFYQIGGMDGNKDLLQALRLVRAGYGVNDVLPVAMDSSGDIFCLKSADQGGAMLMFEAWGAHQEGGYTPVYVAAGFHEFLGRLYEFKL